MGTLWQDLRFGLRMFGKSPGFTAVAILTLALAIGATTVMFSAIDSILLEPFPYRDADRLVSFFVHDVTKPKEFGRSGFSAPEFTDLREQNHVFEDVLGFSNLPILYTTKEGTETFLGCWVTGNISDFLGMTPVLGRPLGPQDTTPEAPPVFAMSDRLWAKQFNRDPKILGTTFTLNGTPRTLVEIMPPRFILNGSDFWIPIGVGHTNIMNADTGNFPLYFQARERLKPGVTLQAASADINVIAQHLSTVYAKDYPKQFNIVTKTLGDVVSGEEFRGMLYALMGAVLMLLLIACSNIANLLLARATAREKEIAIRTSLGAGRGRLIRQLLIESFMLSAAGCVLGCLLAYFGLKALVAEIPLNMFSQTVLITLNSRALLFAVGIAMVATLLCGLAPAIHAVRGALQTSLSGTGKGVGTGYRHGKLRSGLVIGEVALSILLLTGAGLMMRSLFALEHVDLGINPNNVLFANLSLPKGRYDTASQKGVLFRQVIERIGAMPGVNGASVTTSLPPFGGLRTEVVVPGTVHADQWYSILNLCSESYLRTMGIHLLRGRFLTEEDVNSARHVIVVNQLLTKNYFKDEDPIGKTIKFNFLDRVPDAPHDAYFEIVGVVADVKNQGLKDPPIPESYVPHTITGAFSGRSLMISTASDPLAMVESIRREVWAIDSNIALTSQGSIEDYLKQFAYAGPKFGLISMGIFAGIGLVLVVIGVFSVMAYSVSLQTHEIGVRMALGAQREHILRMVLTKGLVLIGAGIVIGLFASLGLTRFIASQIWGVSATDPWTYGTVALVIVMVGLVACLFPARWATKVDPMIALRYE